MPRYIKNGNKIKYEHLKHKKTNNPHSAYAIHIVNNQHEYGFHRDVKDISALLGCCAV